VSANAERISRIAHFLAIGLAIAVALYLVVVPTYGEGMSWVETAPSGRQVMVVEKGSMTLLDVAGTRILIALAIAGGTSEPRSGERVRD
jgi:hypothetical protein